MFDIPAVLTSAGSFGHDEGLARIALGLPRELQLGPSNALEYGDFYGNISGIDEVVSAFFWQEVVEQVIDFSPCAFDGSWRGVAHEIVDFH